MSLTHKEIREFVNVNKDEDPYTCAWGVPYNQLEDYEKKFVMSTQKK